VEPGDASAGANDSQPDVTSWFAHETWEAATAVAVGSLLAGARGVRSGGTVP